MNEPPTVSRVPVMIGGGGEKKTLRMVAQYADESNLICAFDEIPHKLEVLAGHCEAVGRDRSEITVSGQVSACIAPTHDQAEAEAMAFIERAGIFPEGPARQALLDRYVLGDPDEVAERLQGYLDAGLDGWTINLPANGHDPDRVALLGETAAKLLV
jgi:alkanesulfonate monooxygenase SsuD/methylene tetrahydromethanopterin reductase-like flavin-dependent oxidoreductase (luciferase family)